MASAPQVCRGVLWDVWEENNLYVTLKHIEPQAPVKYSHVMLTGFYSHVFLETTPRDSSQHGTELPLNTEERLLIQVMQQDFLESQTELYGAERAASLKLFVDVRITTDRFLSDRWMARGKTFLQLSFHKPSYKSWLHKKVYDAAGNATGTTGYLVTSPPRFRDRTLTIDDFLEFSLSRPLQLLGYYRERAVQEAPPETPRDDVPSPNYMTAVKVTRARRQRNLLPQALRHTPVFQAHYDSLGLDLERPVNDVQVVDSLCFAAVSVQRSQHNQSPLWCVKVFRLSDPVEQARWRRQVQRRGLYESYRKTAREQAFWSVLRNHSGVTLAERERQFLDTQVQKYVVQEVPERPELKAMDDDPAVRHFPHFQALCAYLNQPSCDPDILVIHRDDGLVPLLERMPVTERQRLLSRVPKTYGHDLKGNARFLWDLTRHLASDNKFLKDKVSDFTLGTLCDNVALYNGALPPVHSFTPERHMHYSSFAVQILAHLVMGRTKILSLVALSQLQYTSLDTLFDIRPFATGQQMMILLMKAARFLYKPYAGKAS